MIERKVCITGDNVEQLVETGEIQNLNDTREFGSIWFVEIEYWMLTEDTTVTVITPKNISYFELAEQMKKQLENFKIDIGEACEMILTRVIVTSNDAMTKSLKDFEGAIGTLENSYVRAVEVRQGSNEVVIDVVIQPESWMTTREHEAELLNRITEALNGKIHCERVRIMTSAEYEEMGNPKGSNPKKGQEEPMIE